MNGNMDLLRKKSLVLLFAYSPAGLGHLRVTDALYHGLPKGITPTLLGSQDESITMIHRITSIHPIARSLFEWAQSGQAQYFFIPLYRFFLRNNTKQIYAQINTILDQRLDPPKTLLIVATHFGLAHQIAAIKAKLMKERKVKIILAVQVTDDSPQFIWYVDGADLIFVPSERTKKILAAYGKKKKYVAVSIVVTPYPIAPALSNKLSEAKFLERQKQFSQESETKIQIAFPVSGAAVGMFFFVKLVDFLYEKSARFMFHVISKTSLYTLPYLNELMSRSYVKMHLATEDKAVVSKYEEIYKETVIGFEITKPSEQTFKALSDTTRVGGPILLFAEPVGRQEYENIDFLIRHHLVPTHSEQKFLWEHANKNLTLKESQEGLEILNKAKNWRGFVLPHHSKASANFIWWAYEQGLFTQMMKAKVEATNEDQESHELLPNGVEQFWEEVAKYAYYLKT